MGPERKQKTIVYISSSSYFSNGITSQQKKISFVKDGNRERGRFVQYKDMAPVKQVDNVAVVKSLLGIKGTKPQHVHAKLSTEQKQSKAAKPRPEHKKRKARK